MRPLRAGHMLTRVGGVCVSYPRGAGRGYKGKARGATATVGALLALCRLYHRPLVLFGCGMNYNMEYDPNHKCLLLVTGAYGHQTVVWALRVGPVKNAR